MDANGKVLGLVEGGFYQGRVMRVRESAKFGAFVAIIQLEVGASQHGLVPSGPLVLRLRLPFNDMKLLLDFAHACNASEAVRPGAEVTTSWLEGARPLMFLKVKGRVRKATRVTVPLLLPCPELKYQEW